jgi:hypothetical protein
MFTAFLSTLGAEVPQRMSKLVHLEHNVAEREEITGELRK